MSVWQYLDAMRMPSCWLSAGGAVLGRRFCSAAVGGCCRNRRAATSGSRYAAGWRAMPKPVAIRVWPRRGISSVAISGWRADYAMLVDSLRSWFRTMVRFGCGRGVPEEPLRDSVRLSCHWANISGAKTGCHVAAATLRRWPTEPACKMQMNSVAIGDAIESGALSAATRRGRICPTLPYSCNSCVPTACLM